MKRPTLLTLILVAVVAGLSSPVFAASKPNILVIWGSERPTITYLPLSGQQFTSFPAILKKT